MIGVGSKSDYKNNSNKYITKKCNLIAQQKIIMKIVCLVVIKRKTQVIKVLRFSGAV